MLGLHCGLGYGCAWAETTGPLQPSFVTDVPQELRCGLLPASKSRRALSGHECALVSQGERRLLDSTALTPPSFIVCFPATTSVLFSPPFFKDSSSGAGRGQDFTVPRLLAHNGRTSGFRVTEGREPKEHWQPLCPAKNLGTPRDPPRRPFVRPHSPWTRCYLQIKGQNFTHR